LPPAGAVEPLKVLRGLQKNGTNGRVSLKLQKENVVNREALRGSIKGGI